MRTPRGEFENRDREEMDLGDLPHDLAVERGEQYGARDDYSRLPSDMRNAGAQQKVVKGTPYGAPELDFNVRSVFDSRPVNGFDFKQTYTQDIDPYAPGAGSTFQECMVVPAGYVAVLREIEFLTPHFVAGGVIVNNLGYDLEVWTMKNSAIIAPLSLAPSPSGAVQRGNFVKTPGTVKTFQVYDEYETIGVQFITYLLTVGTFEYNVSFSGSMILKTGVAANFAVANLAGTKPISNAAPAADIESSPGQEDLGIQPRGTQAQQFRRRKRGERFANVPRVNMDPRRPPNR
jgi:hypothetical protein